MAVSPGDFPLNLRGHHRLGGGWKDGQAASLKADLGSRRHVGHPGAGIAEAASTVAERNSQIRDRLAESDVFGALPDEELDRLIGQGRIATYASGAIVFRKGDPAEDLMTVLCGRIRLGSMSYNGREVLFDFIGPGRCFGETALLDGRARKRDARAVRPSAVFALRRRDVLACLKAHSEVAIRMIRVLCARLGRAMEMFEERAQLGLSPRTARMLLRLASEYGSPQDHGIRIGVSVSQGDLAALIGATREKVNRQLRAWCRSGILAFDDGHLTIQDASALRAVAGGADTLGIGLTALGEDRPCDPGFFR